MLTVDYDRLGLEPGHRILDMGCGGGRHAYESLRRGAHVVALDAGFSEVQAVAGLMSAMIEAGECAAAPAEPGPAEPGPPGQRAGRAGVCQPPVAGVCQPPVAGVCQADALCLPFRDGSFDRIIAAEVLEHIPSDGIAMEELARVLAPGGRIALTVPRFGPELVNWILSDAYHNVEGGHVRIYTRSVLLARMCSAGLVPQGWHHAHALHSPYWWLRCLVGPWRDDHPLVQAYHRLLVWDIVSHPPLTRNLESWLNPVIGKSLVVYAEKAA